MARHRFQIGDQVRLVGPTNATRAEAPAQGSRPQEPSVLWMVERLLPADDSGPQYRVRSPDGTVRTVHERDIEFV